MTETPSLVAIRSRRNLPLGELGGAGAATLVAMCRESLVSRLVLGVELHEVPVHFHLGGEPLGAAVLLGGQGQARKGSAKVWIRANFGKQIRKQ